MKRLSQFGRILQNDRSGIALVMTLLIIAMLTVLVVGFNAAVRSEAGASRNFNASVQASQFADLGTAAAVTQLASAFTNTGAGALFATMPGLAVRVQPGNNPSPILIPLVSTNSSTSTGFIDMNRAGTNGLIHPDTNIVISAAWVNVTNAQGEVIGRYAFWVDDESTKMNINAADLWGTGRRPSPMPSYQRFFEIGRMPGTNETTFLTNFSAVVAALTNSSSGVVRSNRTAFHISQAAQSTATNRTNAMVLRWLRWNATASGTSTNLPPNLWGTNGWNINGSTNTNFPPLVNALTNWNLTNGRFGDIPVNMITTNQATNHILNSEAMRSVFGTRGFTAKYSAPVARQIAANIATFWNLRRARLLDTNTSLVMRTVPGTGAGYQWGDGGTPPRNLVPREDRTEATTWSQHNGQGGTRFKRMIPKYYAGRDLSPMLSKVDFQVTYEPPAQPGAPLEANLWISAELYYPYETPLPGPQDGPNFGDTDGDGAPDLGVILVQLQKFRMNIPQANGGQNISWSSFGERPKLFIQNVNLEGGFVGPENESGTSVTLDVARSSYDSEAVVAIPVTFGSDGTANLTRSPLGELFIEVEDCFPFTVQQAPGAGGADLANFTLDAVYAIVDSVRYLTAGRTGDPNETSVKDWLGGPDLRQILGGGRPEQAQMNFVGPRRPINAPFPDWSNRNATYSFYKNDPRVRTFASEATDRRPLEEAAWRVTSALDYDQRVPGEPNLQTDNTTRKQTLEDFERLITNRPTAGQISDLVTMQTNRAVISSVWDLGQIHTGLPWRTLRFGPTEAGVIPDWVLLEQYWPGGQPPPSSPFQTSRLNVNSRIYAAATNQAGSVAPVLATNGNILSRSKPIESALAFLTNAANLAGPGGVSSATNHIFPEGSTNLALGAPGVSVAFSAITPTAMTNLARAVAMPEKSGNKFNLRWSPKSSWGQDRGNYFGRAPSAHATTDVILHTLFSPLELLEIAGMVDPVGGGAPAGEAGDYASEFRMKMLSERLDVRGSAFTVWSVGQTLKREAFRGNTVTNVVAESARETLFGVERDTSGNLRIVPLFTQPIVYK
jgi:hypothetical protein